ncbi:phenylalanine ammonia-lyase [Bisporella sp. PMI_857]|nr:phenylalanine ammonia-lyase [Bisporella sp. PMI_857]
MSLAAVIAIARYGVVVDLDPKIVQRTLESKQVLEASLSNGEVVYGVNTGLGASANTRTKAIRELQNRVMRGLNYGVLSEPSGFTSKYTENSGIDTISLLTKKALLIEDSDAATCMPESWVRASMLIRLNSLAGGASGVRINIVENLTQLLNKDIIPRVPIRGSISASGDLSPLSYVGGLMMGTSTLTAWNGDRSTGERKLVRADVALKENSIKPVVLEPKEGLAIVNGTAFSAGVSALAIHEALNLAAVSQILTAMSVDALGGAIESFDPFFSEVRPHPGQKEAAQNIYSFLADSLLRMAVKSDGASDKSSFVQDRYSIRTAPQWIGPVLEDLLLAYQQVVIECNSATDNPLIDANGRRVVNGGNFQAKSITSAMEKTRQGLETLGRMLFAQCTELINPATNRGLPPNLVVEEPSESFIWKGTDVMIAALQSELGFLANPVGNHVQTAEMGNQALNSLALISSRYTLDAADVLSQMAAAHLLALCQALDIRALNFKFLAALQPEFRTLTAGLFLTVLGEVAQLEQLQKLLWANFVKHLDQSTSLDTANRFQSVVQSLQPIILESVPHSSELLEILTTWTKQCSKLSLETYIASRAEYLAQPDATFLLGLASRKMYQFVRETLSIPIIVEATITAPDPIASGTDEHFNTLNTPTIGTFITRIYQAIRTGSLYFVVADCLRTIK